MDEATTNEKVNEVNITVNKGRLIPGFEDIHYFITTSGDFTFSQKDVPREKVIYCKDCCKPVESLRKILYTTEEMKALGAKSKYKRVCNACCEEYYEAVEISTLGKILETANNLRSNWAGSRGRTPDGIIREVLKFFGDYCDRPAYMTKSGYIHVSVVGSERPVDNVHIYDLDRFLPIGVQKIYSLFDSPTLEIHTSREKVDAACSKKELTICEMDCCSFYPPVNGVYTCKYCGKQAPVYNAYAK